MSIKHSMVYHNNQIDLPTYSSVHRSERARQPTSMAIGNARPDAGEQSANATSTIGTEEIPPHGKTDVTQR